MKSVQSKGTQLDCTPGPHDLSSRLTLLNPSSQRICRQSEETSLVRQTAEPQPTTLKRISSKGLPMKSVQSKGTQLDCTPGPHDLSSRLTLLTPSRQRILRQLEKTSLDSAHLAWNHYRSPSVVRQTPDPPQPEMPGNDSSGNDVDLSMDV